MKKIYILFFIITVLSIGLIILGLYHFLSIKKQSLKNLEQKVDMISSSLMIKLQNSELFLKNEIETVCNAQGKGNPVAVVILNMAANKQKKIICQSRKIVITPKIKSKYFKVITERKTIISGKDDLLYAFFPFLKKERQCKTDYKCISTGINPTKVLLLVFDRKKFYYNAETAKYLIIGIFIFSFFSWIMGFLLYKVSVENARKDK